MDTKHREERKRYIRTDQSGESIHIYQEILWLEIKKYMLHINLYMKL